MKRIEQLQNLSREHHQSLILSQKMLKISQANDAEAIAELCKEIIHDYPEVWKIHFKIEEDSIFQIFFDQERTDLSEAKQYTKILNLCHILKQEHQTMNGYYERMKKGDYSILGEFGSLLKEHTRTEERQLFPLLEDVLDSEELNNIYQVSQDYRNID